MIGIDERPPVARRAVLAVQHVLAAFAGIVAVPLIVGGALGVEAGAGGFLVSHALIGAGIATWIQTRGIGPIGARLPLVSGTDFTFVAPALQVAGRWGYGGILGGAMLGSVVEILLGAFIHRLRRLFPPLVSGVVVLLIGLSLIPVAVDWSAGLGMPGAGDPRYLAVAAGVAAVALLVQRFGRGFLASIAVLLAMVAGCAASFALGWVDLRPVAEAAWFSLPRPLHYRPVLDPAAALPFVIAYFVTAMETTGQVFAVGEVAGVEVEGRHLRGGVLADGVASGLVALVNAMPTNAFSQNIGLVSISGVASRSVVLWAGSLLILLGLFPKLGALVAVIPAPVLGGAGLVMFGLVAAAGVKMLREVAWTERDLLIAALGIAAGVAVITRPAALARLPEAVRLLAGSGIAAGGLVTFALNALLPGAPRGEPPKP